MSIPDPLAALIAYLKADADVTAAVGTRVFGGELPPGETKSMPRKAIVIRPSGGPQTFGGGYQQYGELRLDFFAYGETPLEAFNVWRALHPALKQMRRNRQSTTLLHWAQPSGSPIALRDPDTDWSYNFSSWVVLAAEVAAA